MESHPEPHQEVFHMKVESSDGGTLNITIDDIDSGGKTIVLWTLTYLSWPKRNWCGEWAIIYLDFWSDNFIPL